MANEEKMTLLRLKAAAAKYFPDGSISAASLRGEARKGRLKILQIAKKDFVTDEAMEEMLRRCQHQPKVLTSSSTAKRGGSPSGSYEIDNPGAQQDALLLIAQELIESSKSTSRGPLGRTRAKVIRPKFKSVRS